MSSILHDIADAVKDLLDGASLSKSFTSRLVYDTELQLEDLDTLHVDLVAAGLSVAPESRASLEYNALIDIAVRYRFGVLEHGTDGSIDVEEIAPYLALLEEIGEYLADPDNRRPPFMADAAWIGNEIRSPWVPEHLRNNRQYTGIMRATYALEKDV